MKGVETSMIVRTGTRSLPNVDPELPRLSSLFGASRFYFSRSLRERLYSALQLGLVDYAPAYRHSSRSRTSPVPIQRRSLPYGEGHRGSSLLHVNRQRPEWGFHEHDVAQTWQGWRWEPLHPMGRGYPQSRVRPFPIRLPSEVLHVFPCKTHVPHPRSHRVRAIESESGLKRNGW